MDYLKEISKQHNKWINMVMFMGSKTNSEDIVQDMYIKVHKYNLGKKAFQDDKLNGSYIWRILYSLFIDSLKKESKHKGVQLDLTTLEYQEPDIDREQKCSNLNNAIETLPRYERKLVEIYMEGHSIRKIAKETNIEYWTIFRDIKRAKDQLRILL